MAHYGIGELTAVTILAELGDCTRFSSSGKRFATPGWTSPCISQTSTVRRGTSLARDRRRCAGRCMKQPRSPDAPAHRTATTTPKPRNVSAATGRVCRLPASCSSAATTRCASSARRHSRPHELPRARQAPNHTDAPRPAPDLSLPPPPGGRPRKTERPQRFPQRDHPIKHHVTDPGANPRVANRSKAGRPRAHNPHHQPRARPAAQPQSTRPPRTPRLTKGSCTSKGQSGGARSLRPGAAWPASRSRHSRDSDDRIRIHDPASLASGLATLRSLRSFWRPLTDSVDRTARLHTRRRRRYTLHNLSTGT